MEIEVKQPVPGWHWIKEMNIWDRITNFELCLIIVYLVQSGPCSLHPNITPQSSLGFLSFWPTKLSRRWTRLEYKVE